MSPTKISYRAMKARCCDPQHEKYPIYGGRGVKICDRWLLSYANFRADMGRRPEGYTLDRKDSDGDYTPENCRWATAKEQRSNRKEGKVGRLGKCNTSGVVGVYFLGDRGLWASYGFHGGPRIILYYGQDFFEAACARKSWEVNVRNG
jgi:hypothetical protein